MKQDETTQEVYAGDGRSPKSAGQLMKEITEDLSTLVRKEIELAKQELGDAITTKVTGAVVIGIAGVLGFFALIYLTLALRDGLTELVWQWAADLITAGVLILIGVIGALIAKRKLAAPISTELTKQTIKEDIEWAKTLGRR
jgi:uncharacterized membrane protein YqjE